MSETDQATGFQGPSSTEIKAIMEKAVADSVSAVSDSIARAVDHRLEDFKRRFLSTPTESDPPSSKRLKIEAKLIKCYTSLNPLSGIGAW